MAEKHTKQPTILYFEHQVDPWADDGQIFKNHSLSYYISLFYVAMLILLQPYIRETLPTLLYGETSIDVNSAIAWMRDVWIYSIHLSVIYVAGILALQAYMKTRRPCDLRAALVCWLATVTVFNVHAAYHTTTEVYSTLAKVGLRQAICDTAPVYDRATGPWLYWFIISKAYLLLDTLFLVLRKRQLNFLHIYHHFTVVIFCWHSYGFVCANGRLFAAANACSLSLKYTLSTLKALRIYVPRWLEIFELIVSLFQMGLAIVINILAYNYLNSGRPCSASYSNIYFAFLIYFTYTILIANYFYKVYLTMPYNSTRIRNSTRPVTSKID